MRLTLNRCHHTGAPILSLDFGNGGLRVAGDSGHYREIRQVDVGEIPADMRPRIQDAVARAVREHPDLREAGERFLDGLYGAVCLRETWRQFKAPGGRP